jgi:hypothetical protein
MDSLQFLQLCPFTKFDFLSLNEINFVLYVYFRTKLVFLKFNFPSWVSFIYLRSQSWWEGMAEKTSNYVNRQLVPNFFFPTTCYKVDWFLVCRQSLCLLFVIMFNHTISAKRINSNSFAQQVNFLFVNNFPEFLNSPKFLNNTHRLNQCVDNYCAIYLLYYYNCHWIKAENNLTFF